MSLVLMTDIDETLLPTIKLALEDMYDEDVAQDQYQSPILTQVFITYGDYEKFKENIKTYRQKGLKSAKDYVDWLFRTFKLKGFEYIFITSQLHVDQELVDIASQYFEEEFVVAVENTTYHSRVDYLRQFFGTDFKNHHCFLYDDNIEALDYARANQVIPIASIRAWNKAFIDKVNDYYIEWEVVFDEARIKDIKL